LPQELVSETECSAMRFRKEVDLRGYIRGLGSVVVAYSGGVDSALVLKVATEELGGKALGALGVSPTLAPGEAEAARETAKLMGAEVAEVAPRESTDPAFSANPPDRCYYCKRALLAEIRGLARERGFSAVADGFNADDWADVRPGQQAAREAGVVSPLAEAGLGKAEVRALARALGVPVWDRPATPCLASRIPYGTPVTPEILARVAEAERAVRSVLPGLAQVRIRHFGARALVQVDPDRVADLLSRAAEVASALRGAGYEKIDIDPAGYRRGFLNIVEAVPGR